MKFTFPPESTPLPGLTIKRAIHRGGFGEVYYGLTDAGKEVALKLLHQHTDVELRGATACLNLNHPNLVTIYDIKTDDDGDHWVVMEYVGGKRLADVLDERSKLPVEEIERWTEGMAAGLTFLHDRGIVHRDLKPSNVFSENGIVKVGDVGLSKFISESRRSAHTQSVGTVYYMAPEVARGRYGREVDVYALGIMIYEMYTGDVPFDGESSGEILMKHLSERPNLEKLPAALRPVIARALEKDTAKRTATVARLRDEFKSAVRGRTFNDRPNAVDEEPMELSEDSFIDLPPHNGAPRNDVHPAGAYASAARADADVYSQRARERATGYQRDVQDWNTRRSQYTREERKAVASAFGPGPRGCGGRGHHHKQHAHRKHSSRCCGGPIGLIKKKPWIILIAVALFLLFTRAGRGMLPEAFHVLGMTAIIGAYIYLIVFLFRYFTGKLSAPPAPVHVPVNAGTPPQMAAARRYVSAPPVRRREIPKPETKRTISARSRASQLSGALTIASLVTAALTAGIAWAGFFGPGDRKDDIIFFGASTLLASWLMLSANKFVEGRGISTGARRLLQTGVAIATGAGVWMVNEYLMFGSPTFNWPSAREPGIFTSIGPWDFTAYQEPSVWGYIVFFAALMLSGMWWHASDSYRKKRFSVWRTGLMALIGFAASVLFPMPTAWGIVWAVVIFSVVQLSAPWTPPEERVASVGGK